MTSEERKKYGAKGGSITAAQSKAKAKALRKLHASRRGKHVNPDTREREIVLSEIASKIRKPVWGVASASVVARFCGVDPRTVRRWLSGKHWPDAGAIRRLQAWLKQF
jgi:transcriptional regulator with XRE-family HTH domain